MQVPRAWAYLMCAIIQSSMCLQNDLELREQHGRPSNIIISHYVVKLTKFKIFYSSKNKYWNPNPQWKNCRLFLLYKHLPWKEILLSAKIEFQLWPPLSQHILAYVSCPIASLDLKYILIKLKLFWKGCCKRRMWGFSPTKTWDQVKKL